MGFAEAATMLREALWPKNLRAYRRIERAARSVEDCEKCGCCVRYQALQRRSRHDLEHERAEPNDDCDQCQGGDETTGKKAMRQLGPALNA